MALFQLDFTLLLEAEKNTFENFIEVLKKEEDALIQGKIEQIDFLASNKAHLIEELIQIDKQRNDYLHNQGLILEKTTINSWFQEQHADRFEVQVLWNELLALASVAQKINYSNGLMISTRLQHNARAYAALHCAAGNISLYGPKGQTYI